MIEMEDEVMTQDEVGEHKTEEACVETVVDPGDEITKPIRPTIAPKDAIDGAEPEKTIEERRLDDFVANMNRKQRRAYQSERSRGKSRLEAVQAIRSRR